MMLNLLWNCVLLVLALFGAVSGILWLKDKWHQKIRDRAFEGIFGCVRGHETLVVCPTQKKTDNSPNVPTTHEDTMAQAIVQMRLMKHNIGHKIQLHSDLSLDERTKNLFLICGPVGNSITKQFLEQVPLPFQFTNIGDKWFIQEPDGHPAHPEPQHNILDFAIIAKAKNPWSRPESQAFIYLVAGIEGLGTWGAARLLSEETVKLQKRLDAEGHRADANFAALAKVGKNHPDPTITILDIRSI